MGKISFREQCRLGERADALYLDGDLRKARTAYLELLEKAEHSRVFDAFIVSKIALGLLLTYIKMGDLEGAHKLWTSGTEDYPLGVGIFGLENGQTSVNDLMVYFFICAFLHSMSAEDKVEAVRAVNDYMQRICKYAREENPALLPLAINNWKQHLREIFGATVPYEYADALLQNETPQDIEAGIKDIDFPAPSPWVVDWNAPDDEAVIFYAGNNVQLIPVDEAETLSERADLEG